jgi:hypothetical protein
MFGPRAIGSEHGGGHMAGFTNWWRGLSGSHRSLYLVACYVLIFYGAIDVGRALYQVTH